MQPVGELLPLLPDPLDPLGASPGQIVTLKQLVNRDPSWPCSMARFAVTQKSIVTALSISVNEMKTHTVTNFN